jgi:hypothetical protein
MDLNVKLHELKYNFGKSSGVLLQNYGVLGFFRIFRIILLKKNLWNRFTAAWTGSTPLAHSALNRN